MNKIKVFRAKRLHAICTNNIRKRVRIDYCSGRSVEKYIISVKDWDDPQWTTSDDDLRVLIELRDSLDTSMHSTWHSALCLGKAINQVVEIET